MNASRLLRVLSDLEHDLGSKVLPAIQNLVAVVTAARDNPAQDVSDQLQGAIDVSKESAVAMTASGYAPSYQSILTQTGLGSLSGAGLIGRIEGCFSGSAMNPGGALKKLTELQRELDAARKNAAQTAAGMRKLGIEEYQVADGEFEVGLTLPIRRDKAQLKSLSKEIEDWNKILRPFQEAAGDDEREVQVRSISNSEFLLFLAASPWVADKLLAVVERLLTVYDKILDIRRKWRELVDLGVPTQDLAAARRTEKQLLDDAVAELASEVMKDVSKSVTANRRTEVEAAITISIRGVAKFLDRGGAVEVASPDIDEPGTADVSDAHKGSAEAGNPGDPMVRNILTTAWANYTEAQELARRGAIMSGRGRIESGVLQLDSGEEAESEKPSRKSKT
jgi:hypothetical protein